MACAGSEQEPPRLLHFRISHYNEKVRWALDFKRWPHLRTALVPGFHVPRVRRLSGQDKVPVLQVDGRALHDSSRILQEIEARRPDPPLFPTDPAARARALAIEEYFDEEVAPELRRLFWWTYFDDPAACARMATDGFGDFSRMTWRALFPVLKPLMRHNMGIDRDAVDRARSRLSSHFDRLQSELGAAGYLAGDTFTVADLSAAAVMSAIVRPPEFSYPLPEPWPPALQVLRRSVADHPAFAWVLDTYARHRGRSHAIHPGS